MEKFPWLKLSKVVVNLEVIIHSFEMCVWPLKTILNSIFLFPPLENKMTPLMI